MGKTDIIIFIVLTNVVLVIFIAGVIFFVFQYRRKKILHEKEKFVIAENHKSDLLKTQLNSQRQTMQHIGQEIHDNVGQKLTLASLYTQQLAYENKAPQINDKIGTIGNIINESLAELRQLSKSLTDDNINDNNITELLRLECDRVNELKKCSVVFNCTQKNIGLPYQTKSILLRIVQEFLQNSIKHANCRNIQINLITAEKQIQLNLQDDGKGFEITNNGNGGIGLSNMKKRAELIGGIYHLESTPNNGTHLNITIPL
jgi:signal transduction histidine kinase